jgi:hypothetical protein
MEKHNKLFLIITLVAVLFVIAGCSGSDTDGELTEEQLEAELNEFLGEDDLGDDPFALEEEETQRGAIAGQAYAKSAASNRQPSYTTTCTPGADSTVNLVATRSFSNTCTERVYTDAQKTRMLNTLPRSIQRYQSYLDSGRYNRNPSFLTRIQNYISNSEAQVRIFESGSNTIYTSNVYSCSLRGSLAASRELCEFGCSDDGACNPPPAQEEAQSPTVQVVSADTQPEAQVEIVDGTVEVNDLAVVGVVGDVDWSDVTLELGVDNAQVALSGTGLDGIEHFLYLKNTGVGIYICPDAEELSEVTADCEENNIVRHDECDTDFNRAIGSAVHVGCEIVGDTYKISGLAGSGGGAILPAADLHESVEDQEMCPPGYDYAKCWMAENYPAVTEDRLHCQVPWSVHNANTTITCSNGCNDGVAAWDGIASCN